MCLSGTQTKKKDIKGKGKEQRVRTLRKNCVGLHIHSSGTVVTDAENFKINSSIFDVTAW